MAYLPEVWRRSPPHRSPRSPHSRSPMEGGRKEGWEQPSGTHSPPVAGRAACGGFTGKRHIPLLSEGNGNLSHGSRGPEVEKQRRCQRSREGECLHVELLNHPAVSICPWKTTRWLSLQNGIMGIFSCLLFGSVFPVAVSFVWYGNCSSSPYLG